MLPAKFFDILLYSASINGPFSLDRFCGEATMTHEVSMSKQAFDDRFSDNALAFVKGVLDEILEHQIDTSFDVHFLEHFKRVRIKDATRFDLPDRLKENFPGFGGKYDSEAGVAIQYEFDVKTRKLHDLDITSALKNDLQDAKEKAGDFKAGDLIIRDLGYFTLPVLKAIIKENAFIVSRLRTIMDVFDENQNKISFKQLHDRMVKENRSKHSMSVTIGNKERVPVRLFIEKVPDEVYQERIRKRERACKNKGNNITEEFKARARFTMMITNIPYKDLPDEHIYKLYKIRWQIELIFKTWKSIIGMNKIHPMKYNRFMCLIYAKLILFLIQSQVSGIIAKKVYENNKKFLSFDKCSKSLQINYHKTRTILLQYRRYLKKYVQEMFALLSKNHWLEKKKNKMGFEEIFTIFLC